MSRTREVPNGRLAGWAGLIAILVAVAYAGRAAGGAPDRNVLYRYNTAAGALVEFLVLGAVLFALTHDLDRARVLGLRPPRSWRSGIGLAAAAFGAIVLAGLALSPFLDAGKDQGLVPDRWEPSRAGAFAANFVVIVVAAPLVEETIFRGFGLTAIGERYGNAAAVVVTAIAWGLGHGLVAGLPILVVFGIILGTVRVRTDSVLPGMLTHAVFNAASLVYAVTVGAPK